MTESAWTATGRATPNTALLPNGTVSFKAAFAVPSTTGVVVQVTPGFKYQAVLSD